MDCPTKLYYANNPEIYANAKSDDPFLQALAKGGFQVGALAQCYYQDGILISTKDKNEAVKQTNELLQRENAVIFEAAIMFENLFIRIDILEKKGTKLNLLEVKSKSTDNNFYDELWNKNSLKRGVYELTGKWESYLQDVAFQSYVVELAFPKLQINSFLICPDKSKLTTVDGLNQRFFLKENNEVELIGDTSKKGLGGEILTRLDVTDVVAKIHQEPEWKNNIKVWANACVENSKISRKVDSYCKNCEFRCEDGNLKSGFKECWNGEYKDLSFEDLDKPLVFDVWYLNPEKAIKEHKVLMEDLDESDFSGTRADRQWLQVQKVKEHDKNSFIDIKGLRRTFSCFKYPLHMIDFETCMVAIPFNKGMRPYQQIAFQFSHHVIYEDGRVEHPDEFISNTPGKFPNFEFVRALKKALSKDDGTIFRYSHHENTVLNQIKEQLLLSNDKDKQELIDFIDSITDDAPRTMIDLCELVRQFYYSPSMDGSNSIKVVLPAVLNESDYLKQKYSKPNYSSQNFSNHQWIKIDGDKVKDPYKTLEPALSQYDYETLEAVMSEGQEEINNGGAALTAYAMMQFTQMSQSERDKITKALLRYCELDTLAMVMIYEYWKSL